MGIRARKGWQAGQEAAEHEEMAGRLDAVAATCGLDPDDPGRLGLLRAYLRWCEVHEERPDGRVLTIVSGLD